MLCAFKESMVMTHRRSRIRGRRGATALECAMVCPVAVLLLMGTLLLGLGVFRYEQLQLLAREGARYASVHGPLYASENSTSHASTSTVLADVQKLTVGLSGLDC